MTTIFDCTRVHGNPSFGSGLEAPYTYIPPVQQDNTLPRHPASAADIDEWAALSIQRAMRESDECEAAMERAADRWAMEMEEAERNRAYTDMDRLNSAAL